MTVQLDPLVMRQGEIQIVLNQFFGFLTLDHKTSSLLRIYNYETGKKKLQEFGRGKGEMDEETEYRTQASGEREEETWKKEGYRRKDRDR